MNLARICPIDPLENERQRRGRKSDRSDWERGQINRFAWALQDRGTIDAFWSPSQSKCLFRAAVFSQKKQTAVSEDAIFIGRYTSGVLNASFLEDLRVVIKNNPLNLKGAKVPKSIGGQS